MVFPASGSASGTAASLLEPDVSVLYHLTAAFSRPLSGKNRKKRPERTSPKKLPEEPAELAGRTCGRSYRKNQRNLPEGPAEEAAETTGRNQWNLPEEPAETTGPLNPKKNTSYAHPYKVHLKEPYELFHAHPYKVHLKEPYEPFHAHPYKVHLKEPYEPLHTYPYKVHLKVPCFKCNLTF